MQDIPHEQPPRLDRRTQNQQRWQRPIVCLDHVENTLEEFGLRFVLALEEIITRDRGILEVRELLTRQHTLNTNTMMLIETSER